MGWTLSCLTPSGDGEGKEAAAAALSGCPASNTCPDGSPEGSLDPLASIFSLWVSVPLPPAPPTPPSYSLLLGEMAFRCDTLGQHSPMVHISLLTRCPPTTGSHLPR